MRPIGFQKSATTQYCTYVAREEPHPQNRSRRALLVARVGDFTPKFHSHRMPGKDSPIPSDDAATFSGFIAARWGEKLPKLTKTYPPKMPEPAPTPLFPQTQSPRSRGATRVKNSLPSHQKTEGNERTK